LNDAKGRTKNYDKLTGKKIGQQLPPGDRSEGQFQTPKMLDRRREGTGDGLRCKKYIGKKPDERNPM